jgi:outer membrane protein assembly factor BamE (lipoprotein component of BamABCDE complex)
MKRTLRNVGLLSMAGGLLLAGCSFTQRHELAGRDIDRNIVAEITPGVTTKQEVSDRFGKPDQVNKKADGDEYLYTYRGIVEKTTELVLYAKKISNDERKTLRVLFKDEVVKEVSYTNSNNPDENVSKQS